MKKLNTKIIKATKKIDKENDQNIIDTLGEKHETIKDIIE